MTYVLRVDGPITVVHSHSGLKRLVGRAEPHDARHRLVTDIAAVVAILAVVVQSTLLILGAVWG